MARDSLARVQREVVACERCPRLRRWCRQVARVKVKRFRDQAYWGRPLPGFGDPRARLLIVGLAPAAHGGNRTGRVFTGDRSGDFLFAALHRTGFANQPESVARNDGLLLKDAYIAPLVRCAPPANKPTPAEIASCREYLRREWALLGNVRAILALGKVAMDGMIDLLRHTGRLGKGKRPAFGHGVAHDLGGGLRLFGSYHPSQQNTFTGKLTARRLDAVLRAIQRHLALLLLFALPAAAEVRTESFRSASLGAEVRYAVDLPPSYATSDRTYPVLYVLHGLFEGPDSWERRGLSQVLRGINDLPELVVVAVDGDNSFFVNSPVGRYQDLVTRDLVEHVEVTYRARRGRENRGLLGVSMGGYGALRIAFTHPEVFGAVAAHSAMLLEMPPSADDGAGRGQMAAFHRIFGEPLDPARWAAADPLALAARADPKATPALYFDCGKDDRYGLAAGNEDLHRRLLARGISHTFVLLPGNHGYEYVRSVLERSLRFVGGRLGGSSGGAPVAKRPPPSR